MSETSAATETVGIAEGHHDEHHGSHEHSFGVPTYSQLITRSLECNMALLD